MPRAARTLAALGLSGACSQALPPAPVPPDPLPPSVETTTADAARAWARSRAPDTSVRLDIRFRYQTREGGGSGRAEVGFAPPDTLRFAWQAPFGRRGHAVIVGDDVAVVEPDSGSSRMLDLTRLFWLAFGVPRPPPPDADVRIQIQDSVEIRQYVFHDTTLTYVTRGARHISAFLAAHNRPLGSALALVGEDGQVTTGRIRVEDPVAVLTFTVSSEQ